MPGQQNPLLFGTYKWLGGQVVEVEKFLGETACMRNEERLEYADLEIAKTFLEATSPEIIPVLEILQRMIQIRGMALWPRTEVTDLSAKASMHPTRRTQDLGGKQLLEEGGSLEGILYGYGASEPVSDKST